MPKQHTVSVSPGAEAWLHLRARQHHQQGFRESRNPACVRAASFQKTSVSSPYRITNWSRPRLSVIHSHRFSCTRKWDHLHRRTVTVMEGRHALHASCACHSSSCMKPLLASSSRSASGGLFFLPPLNTTCPEIKLNAQAPSQLRSSLGACFFGPRRGQPLVQVCPVLQ